MQAHRMRVVIPESHRTTIDFPETIPSGPAELIVLVPEESETGEEVATTTRSRGRLAALAAELSRDPRPFRELSGGERRARLRRLRGAGRDLTSGSEEIARRKLEEVDLEDRKLGR